MPLTTAAPNEELVSLAEARLQCSLDADITAWDSLLTTAIASARVAAEHITQRWYAPRAAVLTLDGFGAFPAFELEASPVRSITAVQYLDADGVLTTWGSSNYALDNAVEPAAIILAEDASWPTTNGGANSVRISMDIGYATAAVASAAWPNVKAWMLLHVGTAFRFRESIVAQAVAMPEHTDRLLDSARIY